MSLTLFFLSLALAAFPAAGAAAPGKRKPIAGKLNVPGYTVIALAANGATTSARPSGRTFRLRPPAGRVTLQLRAPDGTYAGPIVVTARRAHRRRKRQRGNRHRGGARRPAQAHAASPDRGRTGKGKKRTTKRRVVVGVRAGAKLGPIDIKPAEGYAKTRRRLPAGSLDLGRWARAHGGVPIGNGIDAGRVSSSPPPKPPPGDHDADGVPDRLDIDSDGNLVLNNFEQPDAASSSSNAARAAQAPPGASVYSDLILSATDTVNANAAGVSTADVDTALAAFGDLGFSFPRDDPVELDCGGPVPGGLSYCAPGGTGHWAFTGPPGTSPPPFPACCDADGDGFGTLAPSDSYDYFYLDHGARSDQIGTGDLLIQRIDHGGVETQVPVPLQFVFATVPALVSYGDTAGNSGSISYPIAEGGPGTFGNGLPVAAGANGDIILTFTIWRPQRRPIPPETAPWIDIGGLQYGVPSIWRLEETRENFDQGCPPSAYSTDDPQLVPLSSFGGFEDLSPDRPANPANTVHFTLNATQCLASYGTTWEPGKELLFHLWAITPNDKAEQTVLFTRAK